MSPAWPVSYETLEPFYAEARADLRRAGAAGIDPTEPPRGPHPHAAIPHEPRIARLAEAFARAGLRPAPMPAAVDFGPGGACVRCGTCDAFACVRDAKGNAETRLLRPLLGRPNVEVMTGARVLRLIAEPGDRIVAAEVLRGAEVLRVEAGRFVLAAGEGAGRPAAARPRRGRGERCHEPPPCPAAARLRCGRGAPAAWGNRAAIRSCSACAGSDRRV